MQPEQTKMETSRFLRLAWSSLAPGDNQGTREPHLPSPGPARQPPLVPTPCPISSHAGGRIHHHSHPTPRGSPRLTPHGGAQPATTLQPDRPQPGLCQGPSAGGSWRQGQHRTHSTRSCLSPAKSFLWIRVMLLPLSSLVEGSREGSSERCQVGPQARASAPGSLSLYLAQACHLTSRPSGLCGGPRSWGLFAADVQPAGTHRAHCWEFR